MPKLLDAAADHLRESRSFWEEVREYEKRRQKKLAEEGPGTADTIQEAQVGFGRMRTRETAMNLIAGSADKREYNAAGVLKRLPDDEFILYAKTGACHWNAAGPRYHDLQELFESQYKALAEIIDEVAERPESFEEQTVAPLAELLDIATLNDQPDITLGALEMIADLLGDHRSVIKLLRADLNIWNEKCSDAETRGFLMAVMKKHEELAWMLGALLEEHPAPLVLNNFEPRQTNIQELN